MAEKTLNSRVVNKHDTEENWLKASNFIPKQGEIIVYDIDENNAAPRMKIGDGTSNVNDLEFVGDVSTISNEAIDGICGATLE